jgi:hypothetical protein
MTRIIALILATVLTAASHAQEQIAQLSAGDGAPNDEFGTSLSISDESAIVGAPLDDDACPGDPFCNSGSAYVFSVVGDTWQQVAKLTASDAEAFDDFGYSVSISLDTAIVGADGADAPESNSGAAYIFREIDGVWLEIATLTASDGAAADLFGIGVAISGDTAIVGAWSDDDAGTNSGSAYVFKEVDGVWEEVAKLTADDGAAFDGFGRYVAIEGDTAVIGADSDDDAGAQSGSAYVFRDIGGGAWVQIAKLTADDGATGDQFGQNVAISGDTVVVGAPLHDAAGSNSGSAYVFREVGSDWIQIAKLTASDASASDFFGVRVAISGNRVVAGASGDVVAGQPLGSAYVFQKQDTTNAWHEAAKITAENGDPGDGFGGGMVSMDGHIAVIGALGTGSFSGSAYVFGVLDTDGDGLLDDWETLGVPYRDENGDPQRYLLDLDPHDGFSDADPMHKDLFVELDELAGFPMNPNAVPAVKGAFAAAPVDNPDGDQGVSLHVLINDLEFALPDVWVLGPDVWPSDYQDVREAWYGTVSERQQAQAGSTILEDRARAVRYCVLADTFDDGTLGVAEDIPCDDFIVAAGAGLHTDGNHDTDDLAATWMHELGHCLGLGHGGGDDEQGKPNYPSIMNYLYADRLSFNSSFWTLDYSRTDSFTFLNEDDLSEPTGISSGGHYNDWHAVYGVDDENGARVPKLAPLNGTPIDFGNPDEADGQQDDSFDNGIEQDLNYLGPSAPYDEVRVPSPTPALLEPHDDWQNLVYIVVDGSQNPQPRRGGELTSEVVYWMDETFPDPPAACAADLDGDQTVDVFDLLQLLDAWGDCPDCGEDLDGNGTVDVFDLLELLAAWGPCP